MVAVMLLGACSSGDDVPEAPPTEPADPTTPTTPTTPDATSQAEIPIFVSMSAAPFEDGTERQNAARRAWTPPTGYYLYSSLFGEDSYENLPNLSQSTIDLFMTHDSETGDATTVLNPLHAQLRYSPATPPSTNLWKLSLPNVTLPESDTKLTEDDVKSGNYYAYGFVPKDAADGAEIDNLYIEDVKQPWAKGAVLTIKGLKSVATDPCVIIGAKHGFAVDRGGNVIDYYDGGYIDKDDPANGYDDGKDERINRLRAGDFQFSLDTGKRTVDDKEVINPNYLFFLFDHLYSALSISMRVNGDYDKLRHIKLKGLKLRTLTSEGSPYKADVTITLRANDEGTNPVSDSDISDPFRIVYSETPGVIYTNSTGLLLKTDYSQFLGNFMPNGVSKLILTSTYDVYDTNITPEHPDGNLVRKDCSATNTLVLSDLFSEQTESKRGWRYKVDLTITPTYLYVMSDPDLDNPTVVVN